MAYCLQSAVPSVAPPSSGYLEDVDLSKVPTCSHNLKPVFSNSKACSLPPQRPYDCSIDLLAGATLLKGKLFNLSCSEKEAMEEYIQEALSTGLIRPSYSPVGADFF